MGMTRAASKGTHKLSGLEKSEFARDGDHAIRLDSVFSVNRFGGRQ